jgi:hypothetical protein
VRRASLGAGAVVGLLVVAGAAVGLGIAAPAPVSWTLRHGGSALLLGAAYALASPAAPRWRRLVFPALSALLAVAALQLALTAGAWAETVTLPFAVGPAAVSGLAAGVYVQTAWRWLGRAAPARPTLAAVAAGIGAFALLPVLQTVTAWHHVALLALYYALWSATVSLAWCTGLTQRG